MPAISASLGAVALAFEVLGVTVSSSLFAVSGALVIVILLVLSGFFSSSEIAMFSLASHRVEALSEESKAGRTLAALRDNPHRLLVTILVGNNLVNIAMSAITTGLLSFYLGNGALAVALSTVGITALVLLFGESAPKSYAIENTEGWALRIARPLKLAEALLFPLVALFDYLTRAVNRITGGRSAIETSYVTRQEIRDIIETGEREGVLDEEERQMLQRTLRFNNTIAKEVMTPRLDMTAVPKEASLEEAMGICIQDNHTRLPVYDGSLDNILGVVHVHELVRELQYGEAEDVSLDDLTEPTLHVPESKNVDDLLSEMRDERMHLVIVVDEFGTTEGLVTMEDLTEEIVGEILEGEEEEPIEFVGADSAIVKGEVNIDAVNEALGIDLPEGEEFETIAGFIFNRAGRLVEEGEGIEYDGLTIRVERVENTRILKARISGLEDDTREQEGPGGIDPDAEATTD